MCQELNVASLRLLKELQSEVENMGHVTIDVDKDSHKVSMNFQLLKSSVEEYIKP